MLHTTHAEDRLPPEATAACVGAHGVIAAMARRTACGFFLCNGSGGNGWSKYGEFACCFGNMFDRCQRPADQAFGVSVPCEQRGGFKINVQALSALKLVPELVHPGG